MSYRSPIAIWILGGPITLLFVLALTFWLNLDLYAQIPYLPLGLYGIALVAWWLAYSFNIAPAPIVRRHVRWANSHCNDKRLELEAIPIFFPGFLRFSMIVAAKTVP